MPSRKAPPSLSQTLKDINKAVNGNPSAKTTGKKVLRQLGVIKPQKRTGGAAAQLKKLFK